MQRSILLSLMIWLLEAFLVATLVSDDWLKTVQQTEDAMTVAYLGKEKDAEIRNTAKRWFDRLCRTGWHGARSSSPTSTIQAPWRIGIAFSPCLAYCICSWLG